MADFNNIPLGLNITTQIPLDVKTVSLTESALSSLGIDNNKAFTYYDGLKVYCLDTRKTYEWREVQSGEVNTGLLITGDFTYPNNTVAFGITYSNKIFNFFEIPSVLPSDIKDIVSPNNTVNITETSTQIQLTVDQVNITGSGATTVIESTPNNFIVSSTDTNTITTLQDGVTTDVIGNGTTTPYSVEVLNLQKTIDTFPHTLTSADDKYTIFVNNNGSNVVINVPNGLVNNFSCVFIQEGTGEVTIQQSGSATLLYPSTTLQNKIKGQYYWAMVEKKLTTNNYYLLGSLLTV